MAANALPEPGSKWLCEEGECTHLDCIATHDQANAPCMYCHKGIGYGMPFYHMGNPDKNDIVNRYAHAECAEMALS